MVANNIKKYTAIIFDTKDNIIGEVEIYHDGIDNIVYQEMDFDDALKYFTKNTLGDAKMFVKSEGLPTKY